MILLSDRQLVDSVLVNDAATTPEGIETRLHFRVKRFVLDTMLGKAVTVVPTRDVMPVLKHVQIELDPGRLRMTASDIELSIVTSTALVETDTPGCAVFPARKLHDIVRCAQNEDIDVTVTGRSARIVSGQTTWNLMLVGGADFPAMPRFTEIQRHSVDVAAFCAALTTVRYAACRDAARSSLMMVEIREGRLTACDGTRIQQAQVQGLDCTMQIPISAVDNLLRLLRGAQAATMEVGQSSNHLIFCFDEDVLVVAKLVAKFPNMELQLLAPALRNDLELTVDRDQLTDAIRRVRITADAETSAVVLSLEADQMIVSARDKFRNEATEVVACSWSGQPRSLVVNHTYLSDLVKSHGGATLSFSLGADTKTRKAPLLLRNPESQSVGVVQQMLGDWSGT